jgi:hypothetical protein
VIWKNVSFNKKKELEEKCVRPKQGGKRSINFDDSSLVTVDQIIERSLETFFPNNESHLGNKNSFKFSLQDFEQKPITKFLDRNNENCSLDKYIETKGLYRSQLKFFFVSEEKSSILESEESEKSEESLEILNISSESYHYGLQKKLVLKKVF